MGLEFNIGFNPISLIGICIHNGGMGMSKVLAISNQKGGVGKTTTCVNLGIGLARSGKKVLLIDTDPQGSLTISLGYRQPDQLSDTLSTVMEHIINDVPFNPTDGILHHDEAVDILPANIELSGIDVTLVNTMNREKILRQYISMVEADYDYILLDCMPSLGMITLNALTAATDVIIPVQAQYLPVKGLEQLLHSIAKVRKQINPSLSIAGILITMVDSRTNYARDIISLLKQSYNGKLNIFDAVIPRSVRAGETATEGKNIFAYSPNGKVAQAYEILTGEVLAL